MSTQQEPISLIFLAYNEAKTIEKEVNLFLETVINKLPGSEFIIAEDGSTDGTTQIIEKLVETKGIKHLTSPNRKGYTKALIDAILCAKNNYIFFSDTGLKNDPQDFWKLYKLRHEYDLIVGRKTNRQDQWYRKLCTNSYNFIIRNYFNLNHVYDADSGFRLFNKKIVETVIRPGLSFKNLVGSEIALKTILHGLSYQEVPIAYFQRNGASRGLPLKKIPSVIMHSLKNLKALKKTYQR